MRTIIAGSRSITDIAHVEQAVKNCGWSITKVVSGCANGVDRLGEQYATQRNIDLKRFPANWIRYGRAAGYIRNVKMAENADALIAIWDGKSKGTEHMINIARSKNLNVYVSIVSVNDIQGVR